MTTSGELGAIDIGTFSKRVLLTGAGFTRNWGGLLAREVWEQLISRPEVAGSPQLKELLLNNFSFEDALEIARTNPAYISEVKVLEAAIREIYLLQEERIPIDFAHPHTAISRPSVRSFFTRFHGSSPEVNTSYLFTLNQDLFVERNHLGCASNQEFVLPGVAPPALIPEPAAESVDANGSIYDYNRLVPAARTEPTSDWPPRLIGQCNYVKLHGSFNWHGPDREELLIVGRNKEHYIGGYPILKWYMKVFKTVCSAGDVRMFISGYSFCDDHINAVIATAVKDHQLQLFIHNPTDPKEMKKTLDCKGVSCIWSGLIGYSSRTLVEIFPVTPDTSQELESIEACFF